ncbi:hypothetical protein C8Q79DRAFT_885559, partial [Trametes meyenii]
NAPAPATPPVSSAPAAPRPRAQNARKRAAQADDAAYHAAAGTKRAAGERADGDRERTKRKRVDGAGSAAGAGAGAGGGGGAGGAGGQTNAAGEAAHRADAREDRVSLIDFTALPSDALHRYLSHFDLVPDLDPSPLSVEDPGPPSSLLRPKSHVPPHGHALRRTSTSSPVPAPPGPMQTVGSRARREGGGTRRRSSRLVEEEQRAPGPPPVYGDIAEVEGVLAGMAERHFRAQEVREVDTLAAFMCAVQAKG